ncbi:hypothetical protein [Neisseria lactamica]|nr:hypothetical protein [Neisseria lactamica]
MPSETDFRRHFMLKPRPASQTAAISGRFVRRQTVFSPHKNNHTAQSGCCPFLPLLPPLRKADLQPLMKCR